MRDLDTIGAELFNKIRGRYPSVTIGTETGQLTNDPEQARFFDFNYVDTDGPRGKVSVSLSEDEGVVILFNSDLVAAEDSHTKNEWYDFLRGMRKFAKKRSLNFDTRDIERNILQKRDYSYLAKDPGEDQMTESKMYGTSRVSYQDVGTARLRLQHNQSVNQESPAGRTQHIEAIYIESADGERFRYPYKHLAGARAMARHVSEGGVPHDDFGKHISSLSEELSNLKKFNTYMRRSSVMAESLLEYMDVVRNRVGEVKSRVSKLQNENFYREAVESFERSDLQEVPEDVQEDWIAQLTIKQFNEELKDVFPYIYKLIGEAGPRQITAEELGEAQPETFSMDDIRSLEKMDIDTAKATVADIINQTSTKQQKKTFLLQQVQKAFKIPQLQGILTNMLLAGQGLSVVGGNTYQKRFEQSLDKITAKYEAGNYPDNMDEAQPEKFSMDDIRSLEKMDIVTAKATVADIINQTNTKQQKKVFLLQQVKKAFKVPQLQAILTNMLLSGQGLSVVGGNTYQKRFEHSLDRITAKYEAGNYPDNMDWKAFDRHWGSKEDDPNYEPAMQDVEHLVQGAVAEIVKTRAWEDYETDPSDPDFMKIIDEMVQDKIYDDLRHYFNDNVIDWSEDVMPEIEATMKKAMGGTESMGEEEQKTPVPEFILSLFDRDTGKFPKGETAVLTAIEKDYGEQYINPAKRFIERIQEVYNSHVGEDEMEPIAGSVDDGADDLARIKHLSGI